MGLLLAAWMLVASTLTQIPPKQGLDERALAEAVFSCLKSGQLDCLLQLMPEQKEVVAVAKQLDLERVERIQLLEDLEGEYWEELRMQSNKAIEEGYLAAQSEGIDWPQATLQSVDWDSLPKGTLPKKDIRIHFIDHGKSRVLLLASCFQLRKGYGLGPGGISVLPFISD